MRPIGVVVLLVLVALVQVTVAPLFPLRGALPDVPLVALALLAALAGPMPVMIGLPLLAVCLGFVSDRSPALLLLAYLPLLPLASALGQAALPPSRYARLVVAGAGTGLWARTVLAAGAIAQGADFAAGGLLSQLLLPGLVLDLSLLALTCLAMRALGWEVQELSLQRRGY